MSLMSKFPGYMLFHGKKLNKVRPQFADQSYTHCPTVPKLLSAVANCVFTFTSRGRYPGRYQTVQDLVEYGLAVFKGDKEPGIIREPLPFYSIVSHLNKNKETLYSNILDQMLISEDLTTKGGAFESLVMLSITRLFQSGRRLDEVFQFHGTTPEWAKQKARIVVRKDDGTLAAFNFMEGDPEVPSSGVACRAEHPNEIREWIESMHSGWCIPSRYMGPDLLTRMQLEDGRLLLIAAQPKAYIDPGRKSLPTRVTVEAIQQLSPTFWFAKSVCLSFIVIHTFAIPLTASFSRRNLTKMNAQKCSMQSTNLKIDSLPESTISCELLWPTRIMPCLAQQRSQFELRLRLINILSQS